MCTEIDVIRLHSCPQGTKRVLLLIDNFVPVEIKSRLIQTSRYDEELEEWVSNSTRLTDTMPIRRPVSQPHRRRPISDYALKLMQKTDEETIHIKGENILAYELDMPLRTTYEYKNPKVSASLQAVLAEALQTDDDIDITEQVKRSFSREKMEMYADFLFLCAGKSREHSISLR